MPRRNKLRVTMTDIYEIYKSASVNDLKSEIPKAEFYEGFFNACQDGNIKVVEYLISIGIPKYSLELGLYDACFEGHIDVVEVLIKNGADNLYKGIEGCEQCEQGIQKRIQIIELLLSHDTKPYALNKEYYKYKHEQLFKYTKMHESLVEMIFEKH